MNIRLIPSWRFIGIGAFLVIAGISAMLVGWTAREVAMAAGLAWGVLLLLALLDWALSVWAWRQAPVRATRTTSHAFALGVTKAVRIELFNPGSYSWHIKLTDEVDSKLEVIGLPKTLKVSARTKVQLPYEVTPLERGVVQLGLLYVRCRTLLGAFEILYRLGERATYRVYPNFAEVACYAWLAGNHRLDQIGIKTYTRRGSGTDFRQLIEYTRGESIRHIDWKATSRKLKPIVRQFQDERDQCVYVLLDCGRRMRANEGNHQASSGHFDQALNATMLLSYAALKSGDEMGVLTFGHEEGGQRHCVPCKGLAALNLLMNQLYDLEPTIVHSDYLAVAEQFLSVHHKRALVIVITNFRDEDAAELVPALRLLRQRHLVMVASLREKILHATTKRNLQDDIDVVTVAAAHYFEQSRRDAFAKTLARDALSVDVEPDQLASTLVSRYYAVKRSGLL